MYRHPSLNRLFLLRVIPLGLVISLLLGLINAWHLQHRFEEELARKQVELLRIGATLLAAPLWDSDQHSLTELTDALLADPDVASVSIRDNAGSLMLARHDGHRPNGLQARSEPIVFENAQLQRVLGSVELVFTRQRLASQILWSILYTLLAVGLMVLTVSWWTLRFNRHHVIAPLNAILDTLRALRAGQGFSPVASDAPGEVGQALRAFNMLGAQLDQAHDQIEQQARRDSLSPLLNRAGFQEALASWFDACPGRSLGILHLDINHFRWINESFGQEAGNHVLQDVAQRLMSLSEGRATLPPARLGGDEFVLAFADADASLLEREVRRLQQGMHFPLTVSGQELFISFSIGGALFPLHAKTLESLLKCVELALHQGKERSRGDYRLYQPTPSRLPAREMIALERDLHHALHHGGLRLVLQPIVSHDEERIIGAEALLRIEHPERGELSPQIFVPVAEESGLIIPLSQWVLEQGLAWLADVSTQGYPDLTLSFNVSVREFHDGGLVERLTSTLARHELMAERIILEVTENLMLESSPAILEQFHAIRALGCRLAIDDFGTGFSSLSYLQHLPFDIIKIDRCFVQELSDASHQAQLVKAMIEMGHALGLKVTVEGIENAQHAAYCRKVGADHLQGYHYARPLPAERFLACLLRPEHSLE
ncbi:putative bifunctional diguanylate cyclase/phosphodiesterase [Litchfieldella rifensis]|uniref:Bifunctional diguanylate cyclase/phosphodiesterase n=1 Tax=Litchfieldella rifensis TaxID=762643 RepID=A0ABV7LS04_9GAMM